MKLARVLLLPSVALLVSSACSDPPSAPPEAAAHITVFPATGPSAGACNGTHGLLTMPLDQRVYDNLNCNLEQGCEPDAIVAVDGDSETYVTCSVKGSGSTFGVNGTLRYKGDSITVSGQIDQNGGPVQMTHYFKERGVGLSGTCTLSILDNRGTVAGGRIWAHFTCPDFTDPSAAGGMDCASEGAFLFQRCDGG